MAGFEAEQPNTGPGDKHVGLRLTAFQQALGAALQNESPNLLTMYLGALHVLQQPDNPDRLALAAHNFRELMNRILRVRADVHEMTISLTPEVINLSTDWAKAVKATSCLDGNDTWRGEIDKHLGRFLQRAALFFKWFEEHRPRRKKEIASVLQKLDPHGLPLPAILEKLNVDTWEAIHDFFVAVAHHGAVDEGEFPNWQYACERFLLERLQPPTFEHHAELDELIQKGEAGDS
jgi:hypothetical protein